MKRKIFPITIALVIFAATNLGTWPANAGEDAEEWAFITAIKRMFNGRGPSLSDVHEYRATVRKQHAAYIEEEFKKQEDNKVLDGSSTTLRTKDFWVSPLKPVNGAVLD